MRLVVISCTLEYNSCPFVHNISWIAQLLQRQKYWRQNVNRRLTMPTLKLEVQVYRNCCKPIWPRHHCQTQLPSPSAEKWPKAYVYKNLQMLPENLSMTDHFKGQERTDQKQEIEICCWGRKQNYLSMEVDESIAACAHRNIMISVHLRVQIVSDVSYLPHRNHSDHPTEVLAINVWTSVHDVSFISLRI